ncbi:formyltetrahydrofolate deformylase [Dinoroseobacter sp. PD6]|uniref:formyltetrahydrofolate deformylase n=1 Tax=Dinoroseobacter sp. PD6 TaxID=3028384 RepID=UPI00237A5DCA|nr:formyltetrahydrofolate deformylase [Dinoroseobacter sp. PD6]MDD9716638.1 formyltetrahydrofolate deformylase [Dinoroseobacter sp. PD6]
MEALLSTSRNADAGTPPAAEPHFVLNLSCAAEPGIVAAVTTALAGQGANLVETAQFWDRQSDRFFLRVAFLGQPGTDVAGIEAALAPTRARFGMDVTVLDSARKPRILIMVSRFDHALLHLLYQVRVGWLSAEVVAIVSNHPDARRVAEHEGVPFHHIPVSRDTKPEAEARLKALVAETGADLVVLARYMQVLSDDFSRALAGRVINIHHSFLPSFKGAKPYHQAHERGVKLIGATAHYVTADLDEGPIIEQEAERITHSMTPDDLVAVGRDIESRVLARAVKRHLEGRVMLNGQRTVVFT